METNNQTALPGVSVVIPCLNEEASLEAVIGQIREGLERAGVPGEVVVCDNGSTDGSVAIAGRAGARVVREAERGYGAALRRGFAAARHEILVMGDADLTYDFRRLDELIAPIRAGAADFVIGNRLRHVRPGAMPALHRYLGTPAIAWVLRIMFHTPGVNDPNCGMRAIRRDAYRGLGCVTSGMEFASEMLVQAIRHGLRLAERDIVYHPRVGESKLRSFRDGWRHLRFLLLYSPTMLLLVPGVLGWVLGLLVALPLAFGPVMLHARRWDIHFMIVAGLLNITSIQVITIGMLAKAYAHLTGLREDPVVAWFYRWFNFERFIAIALALGVGGAALVARTVWHWTAGGYGELNEPRPLFFALLCLVNAVQLGAAGYLFSIMALQRSPAAGDAGGGTPGA